MNLIQKFIILLLGILISNEAFAYDPQTYFTTAGTVKIHYDPSTPSSCLTSAPANATNGQGCATLVDIEGASRNATQATGASQPLVITNDIQSIYQSITYTGSKTMVSSGAASVIQNTGKVSYGGYFYFDSLADTNFLFRAYDATFSFQRLRIAIVGGKPTIQASNNTSSDTTVFQSSTQITATTWHTILYDVDYANNVFAVYVDNVALTNSGGSNLPVAGNIPNTASAQVSIGLSGNWRTSDMFVATGEFMNSTQRGNWNAAVLAQYAPPTPTPTVTGTPPTFTPTPTPTPTNTYIPPAQVPFKPTIYAQWNHWVATNEKAFMAASNGWVSPSEIDTPLSQAAIQADASYYDALNSVIQLPKVMGTPTPDPTLAPLFRRGYRDLQVIPNSGGLQGFNNFTAGLRADFEINGNTTSKSAVNLLDQGAAFQNSDISLTTDPNGECSSGGGREAAYRIMSDLDAKSLGFSGITPVAGSKGLDVWLDQALNHLDLLTVHNQNTPFAKNFMIALEATALIQAYEEYPTYPNRSSIKNAVAAAYDYMWNCCKVLQTNGGVQTATYTYANAPTDTPHTTICGGTNFTNPFNTGEVYSDTTPDLNGIMVWPLGWLYKQDHNAKWRLMGDYVWAGMITNYTGDVVNYGPFFGSDSSPTTSPQGKKQLNQTYFRSYLYPAAAETTPVPSVSGLGSMLLLGIGN